MKLLKLLPLSPGGSVPLGIVDALRTPCLALPILSFSISIVLIAFENVTKWFCKRCISS